MSKECTDLTGSTLRIEKDKRKSQTSVYTNRTDFSPLCPYPGPIGHMTVCQNYNNGNITPKTHSTKSRDINLRPIFQSHTAMFFFREQTLTVKTR